MLWNCLKTQSAHTKVEDCLSKIIALHQNVVELSEDTDSTHTKVEDLSW